MRKIVFISMMLVGTGASYGQQDAQFTQYMDNTLFLNPGYAGSRGMLNITGLHREQWVGMAGRPRTTTLSIHSPLPYESVGLGFTMVNDIAGPIQQNLFYLDASYTVRFKNSPGKLAFGLKGGINLLNTRTDELSTTQGNDPELMTNARNHISPNFGAGIYYHTPKWFVGLSTPKIIEDTQMANSISKEKRHYFLIGGIVFDVSSNWKLRPTTHLKYTLGSPLSVDLSVAGIYKKKFWIGAMHRWKDSFGAFVQFQITPQFKAGLAYDQTVTELIGYNKGTYELLLSYDFVFKKKGVRSPRYF